jgi:hypothetical protein
MNINVKPKKLYWLVILYVCFSFQTAGQVGNNLRKSASDSISSVQISQSGKGTTPERMNSAGRDAIITPVRGMMIFNIDCNDYQLFNGEGWIPVNSGDTMPALGSIRGNSSPCMNVSGEKYSVPLLKGANKYFWKVPSDARIISGQGTNSITVDFGSANGAIYVTAYGKCWKSTGSYLGISLIAGAAVPMAGNHLATQSQIIWSWNAVQGATGYRFSSSNDYNSSLDLGKVTTRTEKELMGNTTYTRYVWAYFPCGRSAATVLTKSTSSPVLPPVITEVVSNITATEATVTANILSDGGSPIIARGVCWSQNPNPTTKNTKTYHRLKIGTFDRYLSNLEPNKVYYVRAYAMNESGLSYGNELIFKTSCASFVPVGISVTASANPVCSGSPVTFCATTQNGGTNPFYQWRVNGTVISGATSATYSYTPAANNVVSCLVTSNAECVSGNPALSNTINLSVTPANPVSVTVMASQTQVCAGSDVTLTATAGNGGKNPAYQWKINGQKAEGATSNFFNFVPAGNDEVVCQVSSSNICVSGNPALSSPIKLTTLPVEPVVASISASANPFAPGTLVTFTASASNAGNNPVYEWMNNGNVVGTGANTYSCIPWNGDNIICMIRSEQKCVKNNPAFSNNIIMTANRYFPTVNTAPVALLPDGSVTGGGEVTSDGGSPVSSKGICWGTTPNPTITDQHSTSGFGSGQFTNSLNGLVSNSRYFVRAYATNSSGTAYGQELTFVTLPAVSTSAVTNITQNSAASGGNIQPGGGETIAARGICYDMKANPTIAGNHTNDGTGTGTFISSISGLEGNKLYYIRTYAKNAAGIVYGNQQTFTTLRAPASIHTDSVTSVSMFAARGSGKIKADEGTAFISSGLCWSTKPAPTVADDQGVNETGNEAFVISMNDLKPDTRYYVRAFATHSGGTVYGNEVSFKTLKNPVLPSVVTKAVTSKNGTTATCRGMVQNDGGDPVTSYGICWSTSPNPTLANSYTADGAGTGEFVGAVTGLVPGTHYYLRAYAVNSVGIAYGNDIEINKYQIGQNFGGGIIFWIDGSGQHGLIAAADDQSSKAPWGCFGTLIGKTTPAAGSGQSNTSAILNSCNQSESAASICNDLVLNGYNDWYLPSKEELNLMFEQKEVIGGLNNANYWSSSEAEANFAWYQSFVDGYQNSYDKYLTGNVRAIRSF